MSTETVTTYTARVGPESAAWLADDSRTGKPGGHAPWGITDNGDGTVSFSRDTLAALRDLPDTHDGYIEPAGVMWIEGDGFEVTAAR